MPRFSPCLLALGLCACRPQLEPITWEGVDIEALREAMAAPTGLVDAANLAEIEQAVVRDRDAYYNLLLFAGRSFLTVEGDAGPAWIVPQAASVSGTSVYLLLACPGPEGDEAAPFANGYMRVDSPQLDLTPDLELEVDGQLLLSYEQCRVGDYIYDGAARLFEDSGLAELGYEPDSVEYTLVDDPAPPIPITQPVLWDLDQRLRVLFELTSGETLVFEWDGSSPQLSVRGRNGTFSCEVVDGLACVPPP